MRAAVLYGKEDVRVEEVAERPLAPGEVRVKIHAALTCGTDLKVFKRGYHARMIVPPAVFGHELAGTICEIGDPIPSQEMASPAGNDESSPVKREPSPRPSPIRWEREPEALAGLKFESATVGSGGTKPETQTSRIQPPILHGPPAPSPIGWERAGVRASAASGQQVDPWKIGDAVVVANSAPCGECFYCKEQQENLCDDLQFLNGAYAESIVVPARFAQKNMLRLKSNLLGADPFVEGALTEPFACVVQGVNDLTLSGRENVLVLGTGPIGLMFLKLCRHLGCQVSMAGRSAARMERALQMGAEQVFQITDESRLVESIKNQTKQRFDVVVEAVGKPQTWEAAVQLVRKGGKVNFFGGCPSGAFARLDTGLVHYSNITLLASFHHTPRTIRRSLALIEAGVISAKDFVDGECSLDQLPELLGSMAQGNKSVKTRVRMD